MDLSSRILYLLELSRVAPDKKPLSPASKSQKKGNFTE
jgi:hypothetical protein